jgi:hypothetical protein
VRVAQMAVTIAGRPTRGPLSNGADLVPRRHCPGC